MKGINKWQYDFMIDFLGLFLSIKRTSKFPLTRSLWHPRGATLQKPI